MIRALLLIVMMLMVMDVSQATRGRCGHSQEDACRVGTRTCTGATRTGSRSGECNPRHGSRDRRERHGKKCYIC